MLNSKRNKNYDCELQTKFIQNRISKVERQFAELCNAFAEYSRKAAKIRNAGDTLSTVVNHYAEGEDVNKSLQEALFSFSKCVLKISDYCNLRVLNIDKNVTNELSQYELICKHCKEDVKEIFASREKEVLRKKQLERIKEKNPKNRQQIIQAETELAKASSEVSHTVQKLEEQMVTFEQKKLYNLKSILLNFINFEIGYHAKALEQLTIAYNDINNINELKDMEEFKKFLQESASSISSTRQTIFKTSQSLSALNLFSKQNHPRNSGIPNFSQKYSPAFSKSVNDLENVQKENDEISSSNSSSESDIENTTSEDSEEINPQITKEN
ncbi:protein FAM92A [Agrilus planipennis]|uniref:Protein FAM92A n=1 Tax=Agrilus planipennis TaxID=224129 RepID=A0A7F5RK16_AGRPL|nr:protein FAM92A [Agrilus planipennis]